MGGPHYERNGLAYCEPHFHQLFGTACHVCSQLIAGDVFTALNKSWCVHHFACDFCGSAMDQRTRFYDVDLRPCCKTCYGRFPTELRRRLKKQYVDKVGTGKGIM